jgi:hypothetical protein
MSISSEALISMTVGAAITWLVAWFYYKRAGDELREEAKALRSATDAILYIQQNPGAKVEVKRDEQGRVLGLIVCVEGQASTTFLTRGVLSSATGA